MKKGIRVHSITDPGHGWLRMSLDDLRLVDELTKICDGISVYSYISPTAAYLEEDRDGPLFLAACTQAGIPVHSGKSTVMDRPAACRSFSAFTAATARCEIRVGDLYMPDAAGMQDVVLRLTATPAGLQRQYLFESVANPGNRFCVRPSQFWGALRPFPGSPNSSPLVARCSKYQTEPRGPRGSP